MKTEKQIAEENIEELILWREGLDLEGKKLDGEGYSKNQDFELISFSKQNEHKASCERFLEKIIVDLGWAKAYLTSLEGLKDFPDFLKASLEVFIDDKQKEREDKENAIKLYNEAGI